MSAARATPPRCPRCGAPLEIVIDGLIGEVYFPGGFQQRRFAPLPTRLVPRPFAACPACEFCIEINTKVRAE